MRIIAGKYRGKDLKEFNSSSTDSAIYSENESIFNLIQSDLVDSVVLDLFSGTGALGIEALSRGAKKCVFVDKSDVAISLIRDNAQDIDGDKEIIQCDYMHYLMKCKQKFDIILLYPPCKTDYGIEAINTILTRDLLNPNGIIIFETADLKELEFAFYGYKCSRNKYDTLAVYTIKKLELENN